GLRELNLDATTYASLHRDPEAYGAQPAAVRSLDRSIRTLAGRFRLMRFYSRLFAPLFQLLLLMALVVSVVVADAIGISPAGAGAAAVLLLRALAYVQQINAVTQAAIEALPMVEELIETTSE